MAAPNQLARPRQPGSAPTHHCKQPEQGQHRGYPDTPIGRAHHQQVQVGTSKQTDKQPITTGGSNRQQAFALNAGRTQLPDRHADQQHADKAEKQRRRQSPGHPIHRFSPYTRPRAKPLATWLRTNQITSMPGRMVNTPAAASTPQSIPEAETVRVITAAMGLASTEVSVRARSSSTQENIKQKNAVTPMPEPISGIKIFTKNFGKL